MTGVRYGVLDLDWLLQSMRLMVAPVEDRARMAVDGEKGLTAVEGFFLGRLYMYRQVYLHKAVRAAESVMRALFRRLDELGPQPGTPVGMATLMRGEQPTMGEFLDLDDHAFETALKVYCDSSDEVLAELAQRLRYRLLFKTLRLRHDVPVATAMAGPAEGVGLDGARSVSTACRCTNEYRHARGQRGRDGGCAQNTNSASCPRGDGRGGARAAWRYSTWAARFSTRSEMGQRLRRDGNRAMSAVRRLAEPFPWFRPKQQILIPFQLHSQQRLFARAHIWDADAQLSSALSSAPLKAAISQTRALASQIWSATYPHAALQSCAVDSSQVRGAGVCADMSSAISAV